MIVALGHPLSGFWAPAGGAGPTPPAAAAITGKLVRPILTHWTNITTSWWWMALLAALGGR